MALRNIIAPAAALIFVSAISFSPAMAAPFTDHAARSAGGRAPAARHSGGVFRGSHRASGGHRYARHRSYSRRHYRYRHHYRSYYDGGVFVFPWALFSAFGPPPYYAGHSYVVCRYRWVRRHHRLVRRRYCWRRYR